LKFESLKNKGSIIMQTYPEKKCFSNPEEPDSFDIGVDQQVLIIAMLLKTPQKSESLINLLKPQYFENPCDYDMFSIIKSFYEKYGRLIDIEELIDEVDRFINENPHLEVGKELYYFRLEQMLDGIEHKSDFLYLIDRVQDFVSYQEQKAAIIESAGVLRKSGISGATKAMLEMKDRIDKLDEKLGAGTGIDKLDVINLGEVGAQEVGWLWPNRIPKGKLSLIVGDPGVGKSYFTIWITSVVTTGRPFPGSLNIPAEKGKVVILTAEDGLADTIVPRLDQNEGDRSLVLAIRGTREEDGSYRGFNLAKDIQVLEKLIISLGDVKLIIIDPVSAYLGVGKDVDTHRDKDVRGVLMPVASLAEKHGVAIIGILHLNKSQDLGAIYRVSVSMAFVAAARSVWLLDREKRDGEDRSLRYFTPIKNNLSRDPEAITFTINQTGVVEILENGKRPPSTEELLAGREAPKRKNAATERAKQFLLDLLKDGPVGARRVEEEAKSAAITKNALRNAKNELGILSKAVYGEAGVENWNWSLPTDGSGENS
jgi:putative DNA primase/helicase